ncbi:MAG: hypothetical protein U1E86_24730 [Burkholderiaceae bacterium]
MAGRGRGQPRAQRGVALEREQRVGEPARVAHDEPGAAVLDDQRLGAVVHHDRDDAHRHRLDQRVLGGAVVERIEQVDEHVEAREFARDVARVAAELEQAGPPRVGALPFEPRALGVVAEHPDAQVRERHPREHVDVVRVQLGEVLAADVAVAHRPPGRCVPARAGPRRRRRWRRPRNAARPRPRAPRPRGRPASTPT